jgi:hypothetical protein
VNTQLDTIGRRLFEVAAVRAAAQDLAVVVGVCAALMQRDTVVELEAIWISDNSAAFSARWRSRPQP